MKHKIPEYLTALHPLARAGAVILGVAMVIATVGEAQAQYAPVDMVLNSLRAQSRGWMTHMLGPARNLALSLGLIQFAWSAIKMGLSPNMGFQSAVEVAFKQLMFVGFAVALIQFAPTWMPAIVDSVQELGRGATGRATPMTPQRVVQAGVEIFVTVYRSYTEINPLLMLPIAGCLIILFALYLVLACLMTLAIAQVYMTMGAGVFLLGFQGSTWTQDLARGYLRYLLAAGVKLMVVTLIVSVGETQVTMWVGLATGASGLAGSVEVLLVAISSVAIVTVMVATLPEYAAAMITGSTGFAGDALVVGLAGAAAGAGVSAAAGAASGGAGTAASAGSTKAVEDAAQVGRGAGGGASHGAGASSSAPLVSGGAGYPDLAPEDDGEPVEGFLGSLDEDAEAAEGQGSNEAETSRPDPGQPPPSTGGSEDLESAPGPAGGATTAAEGAKVSSAAGDRSSTGAATPSASSGRMKTSRAGATIRGLAGRAAVGGAAAGAAGGDEPNSDEDDADE